MPSWRGQLTAADIAAVLTYVRSAWGNSAGPVSEQTVAAVK
jgi:mono/diheme cytochrome c family protein